MFVNFSKKPYPVVLSEFTATKMTLKTNCAGNIKNSALSQAGLSVGLLSLLGSISYFLYKKVCGLRVKYRY